jgi:hypothetical protein
MPSGPLQFDKQVFDAFNTQAPDAPVGGTYIVGTTSITLNWNPAGTELTDQAVVFGNVRWDKSGCGPLPVYDDAMGGGMKCSGTVAWATDTDVMKKLITDAATQRVRWAITPVIRLTRTVTPIDNGPPTSDQVYEATNTVWGEWYSQKS